MKEISTSNAPQPLGHYAQAVAHNGLIFVSGQLPLDPETGELASEVIEDQTRVTLAHIDAILKAAGSDRTKVLKATIYISDLSLWGQVNAVYGEFFGDHRPARAAVPTKDLPRGCQIEIEAVAAQ